MTAFEPDETEALLALAHRAADAAAAPSLRHFRSALAIDDKTGDAAGFDPVTQADRETEAAIRAVIAAARPDDAILGEEEAARAGASGVVWVIDPIDGTRAYIAGAASWGVLIAAGDADGPKIGIIDQPYIGERFAGVSAGGVRRAQWRRGEASRALATRRCARLEDAILMTTFPEIGTEAERAAFSRLSARARLTRYGLDCMAYALLAAGCVDLVVEAGLQPYDVQALIPVVEGAGGVITGWDGAPCAQGGRVVAAGDRTLHARALEVLAS